MEMLFPKDLFRRLQGIVHILLKCPHERFYQLLLSWEGSISLCRDSERLLIARQNNSNFSFNADVSTRTCTLDNMSEILSTTNSRSGSWANMYGDFTLFSDIEMAWSTVYPFGFASVFSTRATSRSGITRRTLIVISYYQVYL